MTLRPARTRPAEIDAQSASAERPYRIVYPLRVTAGQSPPNAGPFAPYDAWFDAEIEWAEDDVAA